MNDLNLDKILGPELKNQNIGTSIKKDTGDSSFSTMLTNSIHDVNKLQQQAEKAISSLAVGDAESIHSTMIALEKAGLSFNLMMQVRNKILDAYREVMRMQV